MSLIQLTNLSFSYDNGQDNIFNNVNLQLDTAWKVGLIGRNGCGKTTLLHILSGRLKAQGIINCAASFGYFPFIVDDMTKNTLAVINSICKAELWQVQRECNLLGVCEDALYRPFSTLSGGERTKVMLAALFLKDNSFLLIDEPTNHLDSEGRQVVASYLKGKEGFILVSHDRNFLDNCIDYVLCIQKSCGITITKGNYMVWHYNKQNQDNLEIAQNQRLETEIEKLTIAAERKSNWSKSAEKEKYGQRGADKGFLGHKAAKIMKSAKVLQARGQKAVEDKKQLLKNIDTAKPLLLFNIGHHSEVLVYINSLNISYNGRHIVSGLNMQIKRGEKVFLRGGNGSGKTSVLKAILADNSNLSVQKASGLKISYVPQDTDCLQGDLRQFAQDNSLSVEDFMGNLDRLGISRDMFSQNIQDMSAGQKKKILIAKSLTEQAHLYVWDEPLNYIDIISRVQIEDLLKSSSATMIIVEHDVAFCNNLADRFIQL